MVATGFPFQVFLPQTPDEAERIAFEEAPGAGRMVAVGGDGTVNRVGKGLIRSRARCALGVIPLGTGNDFARALGMPADTGDALQIVLRAEPSPSDYGTVTWQDRKGAGDSYFLNVCGAGFDAAVARDVKRFAAAPGFSRYVASALVRLPRWKGPRARVLDHTSSKVVLEGPLFLACAGNGATSGGGFRLTPNARIDDELLEACVVRDIPVLRALRLLPAALTGRHVSAREVRMIETADLSIACDTGLPLQADGEVLSDSATTIRMQLVPRGLHVVKSPENMRL